MAYVSQELKKSIAPKVKEILKKYNLKGSLGVHHNSTLVLTLTEGKIDFARAYGVDSHKDINVNIYYVHEHFTGKAKAALVALREALNKGNHNHSDIQSDYFNVGWYVDINIGKWDKEYQLVA